MWFADEARVGQKGTLTYVWAERGSRPLAVRDNRHDSAYLFGAVCPERCIGAAIIMPAVNSEAMAEHLREISTQVAPGAHAVLVLDGAGWHQAGERLPVASRLSRYIEAIGTMHRFNDLPWNPAHGDIQHPLCGALRNHGRPVQKAAAAPPTHCLRNAPELLLFPL